MNTLLPAVTGLPKKHNRVRKKQIRIITTSSDPEEEAVKTANKYGLTYSMGYGLISSEVSAVTRAFVNPEKQRYSCNRIYY